MTASEATEQQTDNPLMICNECEQPVIAYGGRLFWLCEHTNGAVTLTQRGHEVLKNVS